MVVLGEDAINVFSRKIETADSFIDKALKKAENAADDGPFQPLTLVHIKAGSFNPFKRPLLIKSVSESTFLIGFNDGSFQILSIAELIPAADADVTDFLDSLREQSKAKGQSTILCEFQAHSVVSKALKGGSFSGSLDAILAPWVSLQSGDIYTAEFFTTGADKRVAHWGLRKVNMSEEEQFNDPLIAQNLAPKYTFRVDLLGVRILFPIHVPIPVNYYHDFE